ncbi:MAG: allantoinase PuuE [Aestuariivita sp.]|nr:allantoinase PuuE [Aestuariivita sp.]MCY4203033.1 allantoinase PuuE [Aestuariivita sp.]
MNRYPRDMIGYGEKPPNANWPDQAKIAVQFVLNYEEGGENNILHSDPGSEAFLSEIVGAESWEGERHWNMESLYEYGARAGFWRLHRLFTSKCIPVTVFGVATALARSPEQVAAMKAARWEIACHGLKWIEHRTLEETTEKESLNAAIQLHHEIVGELPQGWYTGRCSMNTVRLAAETGQFRYISDAYDDDLPYWRQISGRTQLIIPYTLDANDMRFATAQGFNAGDQFLNYLVDSFDTLYAEGLAGSPKMMSIGLHCRLMGRPGRTMALQRFIEYTQTKPSRSVWYARRIDIAKHWEEHHPFSPKLQPHLMNQSQFIKMFGGIFEHSSWIAERTFALELGPAHDTVAGLHSAMVRVFRSASRSERLGVLRAHPDLAGKLAVAKKLTHESTSEQASAGLDSLTKCEYQEFRDLNSAYVEKHKFPFIIAARDYTKFQILAAFKSRVRNHSTEEEFMVACRQVERIAQLRLEDIL